MANVSDPVSSTAIELGEGGDSRLPQTSANSPPSNHPTSSHVSLSSLPSNLTQELTQYEIDEKPWKYIGYRGFSKFLATEGDFCVFRRFERLNARVILALQDRVSSLEEELESLDIKYSRKEAEDVNNGTLRRDDQQLRVEKIWDIYKQLKEYNQFILQHMQLKARPPAPAKDIQSLQKWFHNNQGAIMKEEQRFIEHGNDLFSLVPKDRSPLRRFFERSSRFRLFILWRKEPPPDLPIYEQSLVHYASDKRIDRFVSGTIGAAGLVMLITPIWILAFMYSVIAKLTVITIFIVVFFTIIAFVTSAKPFETLAATAAYSAILMVFLQLGSS